MKQAKNNWNERFFPFTPAKLQPVLDIALADREK